jgi:hypothetical protein
MHGLPTVLMDFLTRAKSSAIMKLLSVALLDDWSESFSFFVAFFSSGTP